MQATLIRPKPRFVTPGIWMSGLLLALMLLNLAWSLSAARWTDGLGLLSPVVMGGFLLGMAISHSRWEGPFPAIHALVTGVVWVLIWVSRAPQIPDTLLGAERIAYIGHELWQWMQLLFTSEPARSNLVFILELSLLLWWLGFLAAIAVFREGRVWRAILPVGLGMLVNLYYGPPSLRIYFVVFIVCALLLAVRSHLAERELAWRRLRVRYASDIQFDFLRDGLILAIFVTAVSILTPNAAGSGALSPLLEPLRQPWQQVQEEWGRLFSSLNYQAGGARPAFGNTLTLGGPRELGDTVIMDVQSNSGRYWRAATYDTYTGNRWLNTSKTSQVINFSTQVATPDFQSRREVTQTITTYAPAGGVLFAAPQPVRVSLQARASLETVERTDDGEPIVAEVSMLHRVGDLRSGDTYMVVSSLTKADIESLQEAGVDYPEEIRSRYLQLPAGLPARIGDLAKEVTADAGAPFDKVRALERFLRQYPYDETIEAPPAGVDGVDYFLFDAQAGYCDYYASALTIMARTLGIPARVSAGYSQGEYVAEANAYRVRESDGHSWPEVFFPGYGWVEFEPTASETEIERPQRQDDAGASATTPTRDPLEELEEERFGENPELGDAAPPTGGVQGLISGPGWWIGIGAMLLIVFAAAILLLRPASQRGGRQSLVDPQLASRLYGRLIQWGARLGLSLRPSQTPNEHAAVIYGVVPEGRGSITAITDFYVHDQFSPYAPDERLAENTLTAWDQLQPLLRRHWLVRKLYPLASIGRLFRRPAPSAEEEA